tara:strand:+ start:253 stop:411 length:159 start_codon:yes stop_codon:yes gene_type:complete
VNIEQLVIADIEETLLLGVYSLWNPGHIYLRDKAILFKHEGYGSGLKDQAAF